MGAKIYILFYEYPHTKANHAGMAYLARQLKLAKNDIVLIKHIPQEIKAGRFIGPIYSRLLVFFLLLRLKEGDTVLFMEYLVKGLAFQDYIAKVLRRFGKINRLIGIVHLSPAHIRELYESDVLVAGKLSYLDKAVVFGSSLASYLRKLNYQGKVAETFHYVDTNWYKPNPASDNPESLKVISMGSIKRDFTTLKEIILNSDTRIEFHLCVGKSDIDTELSLLHNVTIYGFLPEMHLLHIMQKSDIHLSVLHDTVGSNAITSALAVGLVQVVSNVGSISDYCDVRDSILCNSTQDFVDGLAFLNANRDKLQQMKLNARKKAESLSLEKFVIGFDELLS